MTIDGKRTSACADACSVVDTRRIRCKNTFVSQVEVGIARVLPKLETISEIVPEFVADIPLDSIHVVEVGFTQIGFRIDLAAQPIRRPMRRAAISLVVAHQQSEVGIRRRAEGKRWRDIDAVIVAVFDTLLGILPFGGQTVGPNPIRVDRTTEIGSRFDMVFTECRVDLAELVVLWTLADRVDDTTRLRHAKQRGISAL
ncbi:hypothetical protein D3C71_1537800 [compost metagenome]